MDKKIKINFKKRIARNLILLLAVIVFFGFSQKASAATLSFSSTAKEYTVGQAFSVSVYVGSTDKAVNAGVGTISFSQDKLRVASVSKSGSIFSLWVSDPTFSNSAGTVSFEGLVPNPGFSGARGKILTINFVAKNVGTASLGFRSASVLANDGVATNLLTGTQSTSFEIIAKKVEPIVPAPVSPPVEGEVEITPEVPEPEIIEEPAPVEVIPSPPVEIVVLPPETFWERMGSMFREIFQNLAFLVLFLTFIILLIGFIYYIILSKRDKRMSKINLIEREIHHTFALLRGDLLEQLHLLERAKTKRELTREEKNLTEVIESHLIDAEKYIKKEINSIPTIHT